MSNHRACKFTNIYLYLAYIVVIYTRVYIYIYIYKSTPTIAKIVVSRLTNVPQDLPKIRDIDKTCSPSERINQSRVDARRDRLMRCNGMRDRVISRNTGDGHEERSARTARTPGSRYF